MMGPALSTEATLAAVSAAQRDVLREAFELRDVPLRSGGLGARESALVRVAALIALDAPPASYADQLAGAAEARVGADEILAVMQAIAPQVGIPRVVAAAPEIMVALGISLSDDSL